MKVVILLILAVVAANAQLSGVKGVAMPSRFQRETQARHELETLERLQANPVSTQGVQMDLRWYYYLRPVEDQGGCGSCYVFATVHTYQDYFQTRWCWYSYMSTQNALNCVDSCGGGSPYYVFRYIDWYGITHKYCDPYYAVQYPCNRYCSNPYGQRFNWWVGGTAWISTTNVADQTKWVSWGWPLQFCIQLKKQWYSWGSYTIASNNVYPIYGSYSWDTAYLGNHCMEVIGYGTLNGVAFWLVKNSWGNGWGMGGYVYIRKGYNEGYMESWGMSTPWSWILIFLGHDFSWCPAFNFADATESAELMGLPGPAEIEIDRKNPPSHESLPPLFYPKMNTPKLTSEQRMMVTDYMAGKSVPELEALLVKMLGDSGEWTIHGGANDWCTDPSQCMSNNTDSFTGKRYTGGDRNLNQQLDDGQLTEAAYFAVHVLLSTPLARGGYGCLPPLPDLSAYNISGPAMNHSEIAFEQTQGYTQVTVHSASQQVTSGGAYQFLFTFSSQVPACASLNPGGTYDAIVYVTNNGYLVMDQIFESQPPASGSGVNVGAVVGGSIAAAVVVLAAGAFLCVRYRRSEQKYEKLKTVHKEVEKRVTTLESGPAGAAVREAALSQLLLTGADETTKAQAGAAVQWHGKSSTGSPTAASSV